MSKSKAPLEFMERYKVDSDEVWQVPDGAWVVKHKALERVAAERGIKFEAPQIATRIFETEGVAMLVVGKLGERSEWSFGEASPLNLTRKSEKRPLYPWAMAEKRAKDRVILKLLDASGSLYSEAESDEFTQRQNPHVTRSEDVTVPIEYDQHGNPIDNIPHSQTVTPIRVKDARKVYDDLEKEAWAFGDSRKFIEWMNLQTTIDCVAAGSAEWQAMFRGRCKEHLDAIRLQERGDDQRSNMMMAGA
jgi:hypothetical protein